MPHKPGRLRAGGMIPNRSVWVMSVVAVMAGTLVISLVATGAVAASSPRDPGALTRWGLPVARLGVDVGSALTVGVLLMAAVLMPSDEGGLSPDALRYVRLASWFSAVWAAASGATLLLSLSDILGEPVSRVLTGNKLAGYAMRITQGPALMIVILLTVVIALLARTATTAGTALGLLVTAVIAVLPPPLTDHSASSADHSLALTGEALHVVTIVPWVGGVAILGWHALSAGRRLEVAAARFGRITTYFYVAAGLSGAVNAAVRLSAPVQMLTTGYGRLLVVMVAAFTLLGLLGMSQRRRALTAIKAGRPRAVAGVAAVEAAVLAVAMGIGIALAEALPPAPAPRIDRATRLLGYGMPPPITFARVLTLWRPDLLFATLVVVLGGAYLAALDRLRECGETWPLFRTVSWFAGLVTVVIATMSGIATYAPVLFAGHMVQHMTLTMISPLLLALGGPVGLALRALNPATRPRDRGPREWLTIILRSRIVTVAGHPLVAAVIFVSSGYVPYAGPLFQTLMSDHLGHVAISLYALLAGWLFYWVLLGVDPGPHQTPYVGRILILFVTMPFHAFLGIALMDTGSLARGWYAALGRTWGQPLTQDIHTGGVIAWVFGEVPTLIVLVIMVVQWFRADQRPAGPGTPGYDELEGLASLRARISPIERY